MRHSLAPPALVLALTLVLASPAGAPAQGTPTRALWNLAGNEEPAAGVTRPGATALALAGDHALFVLGTEQRKKLFSIATDGSSRAVDRFRFRTSGSAGIAVKLDASPTLAGALFTSLDQDPRLQAFTGPPLGPLLEFGPLRGLTSGEFVPLDVQVSAGNAFVLEQRINPRVARVTVRDLAGVSSPVTSLTLARDDRPVFAGDLVALAQRPATAGADSEVTIQNWRTGAGRRTVRVPLEIDAMDLQPDGRIVVSNVRGTIGEVAVDGAFRRVGAAGRLPAYAGDAIVYVGGENVQQLMIAGADRVPRPLGLPSEEIDGFAADAQRAVWSAHGCLFVTDLTAAASLITPRGPCPRAEAALDGSAGALRLRSGRRLVVPVRCIAAPADGCRGRVRLSANVVVGKRRVSGVRLGSERLRIAPGAVKRISLRLTDRVAALVREKSTPPEFFGVQAEVAIDAVDPAGRHSVRRECCARLVIRR